MQSKPQISSFCKLAKSIGLLKHLPETGVEGELLVRFNRFILEPEPIFLFDSDSAIQALVLVNTGYYDGCSLKMCK